MQFSLNFLKQYVDIKTQPEKLAELLTMRAFETTVKKEKNNYLLDVSILPNRTHDVLSYIGLAREISVLTGLKLKLPKIKVSENSRNKISDFLNIEVKDPIACPRYIARFVKEVKIGPSPKWLKEHLESAGLRSINNIVDITNFVMLEFGQPMHAFDYDKLIATEKQRNRETEKQILIRRAKKGERITTLDDEEYNLDENILVIADTKKPIAIAGIKGGKLPEIDSNTKNIVLESANFNSTLIRKTSRRLNLRTDSSIRFEADLDPNLAEIAINRAANLIKELSGGKIAKNMIDIYPQKTLPYKIGLSVNKVSNFLGLEISEKEILKILTKFDFEFKKINPAKNIINLAKKLIGKPYKYGASVTYDAPNYFDCSSFTSYIFLQLGYQIPRVSIDQYFYGKSVNENEIKPGDLIFANTKKGKSYNESQEYLKGLKFKDGIDHVGIYLGNGKIAHATRTAGKVIIENLKNSKQFKNLRGVRRIIIEEEKLIITIPTRRKDLKISEDIVEEIGRVYGYEKINPKPAVAAVVSPQKNEERFWEVMAKNIISGIGFSEVYNYSFLSEKDLENINFKIDNIVELENPVSKDFQYMRPSLISGILKNVAKNIVNFNEVRIFELDRIYKQNSSRGQKQFLEKKMITIAFARKEFKKEADEFYEIKGVVDSFLNKLGNVDIWYDDYGAVFEDFSAEIWRKGRVAEIKIGNEKIGIIGEIDAAVSEKFNIKHRVTVADLDFDKIAKLSTEEKIYEIFSKYPSLERDVSILLPLDVRIENVLNIIETTGGKLVVDVDLFDEYSGEKLPEGMKSLAFHIIFQSAEKTLTDAEVDLIYKKIIEALEENIGWEARM